MGYRYYDYEEKRLQRKLIPLNIFVIIICIVAAVSLMVTPFIQVDLSKATEIMAEIQPDDGTVDGEDDGMQDPDGSNSESSSGSDSVQTAILSSLNGKLSLTPLDMAKISFAAEDDRIEILMEILLFESGLFEEIMNSAANVYAVMATGLENFDAVDFNELNAGLEKVGKAESKDEFLKAVDDYVKIIEAQTGVPLDEQIKQDIPEVATDLYEKTTNATNGSFSIEAMVCVFASTREDGSGTVVTTYADLYKGLLDGSVQMPGNEGDNSMSQTMQELNDSMGEYIGYFSYLFYFFCGIAGIWVILFLFAFFHTFAKNKRFTMWYVKIFGAIPCLIFGVVLKVMGIPAVAAALMGADGATALAVLGAVSSMTWISGVCYLLLWLVSIFWAFPIKHKIRKLRR